MVGLKVLCKDGLKGPFLKSSIVKAITSAMIPLQARLLDLETGRYVCAADLVGEKIDSRQAPKLLREIDPDVTVPMAQPQAELVLAEEAKPEATPETPRVFLTGKTPLLRNKQVRMPQRRDPRKVLEAAEQLELEIGS
ncbi:MAG: hypothetical protein IPP14_07170 [Planctomycetes bacterium]|nr:hypothetical protein [Planctomycetota bacterium]